MGVPRADGFWGSCDKNNKKNYRTRSSALISRGNNNVLIAVSYTHLTLPTILIV